MANQRISTGFPFPVYVNETSNNDRITSGVYVDETSAGSGVTVALTGVAATGAAGTVGVGNSVALTGVGATGQVGGVGVNLVLALTGVSATGAVGTVTVTAGGNVTLALSGVSAIGQVGNVTASGPVIVIDDTHDPGIRKRRKKLIDDERERRERNRERVVAAFERIIEGKEEITPADAAEIIAEVAAQEAAQEDGHLPLISFEELQHGVGRLQEMWRTYLDQDDEDVLALL